MGLRIATNISAISAQRSLANNHDALSNTLERLSSGSRINRAGDDAAGLAISEKLRANIRSMKQATRNAQDGIGLVQVAEGGMNEVGNILIRLRELSVQGASDTIGNTERGFIDKEVQSLREEISRIANNTTFNGVNLLNGSGQNLDIQVGINNNPTLDRFVFDVPNRNVTAEALGLMGVNTLDKASSQTNLETLDAAITKLNENRSTLGALQNRLYSTINNLQIYNENLEAANSRIRDTDIAAETSNLAKQNILTQANISVLAQANQSPQMALKLLN
jgi:flagellin